jgi:hypothetical protein
MRGMRRPQAGADGLTARLSDRGGWRGGYQAEQLTRSSDAFNAVDGGSATGANRNPLGLLSNDQYEQREDTDTTYEHRNSYGVVIEQMPSRSAHAASPRYGRGC